MKCSSRLNEEAVPLYFKHVREAPHGVDGLEGAHGGVQHPRVVRQQQHRTQQHCGLKNAAAGAWQRVVIA